jgi:hypothetical protein
MSHKRPAFPFPIQLGALEEFRHPEPGHQLSRAGWYEGEALAANGFMAIRVRRGNFMESDFPEPEPGFWLRFLKLPWTKFENLADDWHEFYDVGRFLYSSATIEPWKDGRCAPSPVWRVGPGFLARKSHLQLIAKLPRCEVHVGTLQAGEPMLFRFSGGIGMLAADARLTESSFEIFQNRYDYDGMKIARKSPGPCVLPPQKPTWPAFEELPRE